MTQELLDAFPLWTMFLLAIAVLWGAMELGYRSGKWRHSRHPDEREQPVGAMVGSILGLLALILAFTFNLAATRFEARRQAILEEANAIGTTWLRSQMLPSPENQEIDRLLREYTDLRIRGVAEGRIDEVLEESDKLHKQLWQQAVSAAGKDSGSIITGLFVQSLNDVIDLHAKRVLVGVRNRIPLVIWLVLFGLAVLGMAAIGYQAALSTTRRSPAMVALVASFAAILYLIADLDRVHEGLIRTSQQALVDVRSTMQAGQP